MWSPNELLKIEKQRDILSYITLQFFHFKKVPLEHCPFGVLPFFCRKAVLYMVKGAQTIAQYKIMRWIDEHFTDVEIKPQKADSVKITDSVGGCMIITINATGDVINALSGEILDREGAMV